MPDEIKEKKKVRWSEAWGEARDLIWSHRRRLGLGLFLLVINRLAGLVLPATSKYLIDEAIPQRNLEMLQMLAIAAAAATLVDALTGFALSQVLGVAAQRAITDMRKRLHEHVLRLPVRYFDSTQTGVLISRIMNDAEGIRNLVGNGLVQLFGGTITALIAVGVLFWLNWELTGIILLVLSVFGGFLAWSFSFLRPLFRERSKINAEVTGRLNESLAGIRVVKAYTAEKREDRVFAGGAHRLFRNVARAITGISATTACGTLAVGVVGVIMIHVGGRAIVNGEMTIGDFVMYLVFTGMLAAPIIQIASIGTQITEAFAGLDRIREIRRMADEETDGIAHRPLELLRGEVVFENVSFEYNPGVRVLKNISLTAKVGTTTALVGPSGSGKSTLISLVMAFNRPIEGSISVDGQDLRTLRLRDYRQHLGVVLQDNFLFDGTVAENIAFSRPRTDFERIRAAGRLAHCDEFVEKMEKQYATVVGERGVRLSGGQRQRIAIARAILADPKILILDEATSSLDSESEAMIQDGLRSLRQGRTAFVIAHRLSTIRSADQILVLDEGEIVERGTHDELMALGGRYKQLHDKQYAMERDRYLNPGEEPRLEAKAPAYKV